MIRFIANGKRCALVALLAMLQAGNTHAQVVTGTILGRVSDTTGAVLQGAAVQIQNTDTGLTRTETTDREGQYSSRNLPLGGYVITITHPGFQTHVRQGIILTVGSEQTVNAELAVGATQEKVQVTAEAPAVETTNATVSGLVSGDQIRDLPLNGRSVDSLALLSPGALANRATLSSPVMGQGMRLSVNGGRFDANVYLLDGTVLNDQAGNGPNSSAGGQALGVEAVREFRLLTHSYSAEYGRNSGSVMSMVTRSGTNDFHGSAYEFLRNDLFDARNFFNPGALPEYRRNQFGVSLGGPIKKDRLFFFFNYEALRSRQGITILDLVPDANARKGLVPTAPGGQVTVNPAVVPFLNVYPLPNGQNFGDGTALYSYNYVIPATENYYLGRMDYRISEKDSFYGRYVYDPSSSFSHSRALPQWLDNANTLNSFLVLSETHIFSPSLLNEFRAAYNRTAPSLLNALTVPESSLPQYLPGLYFGMLSFSAGSQISTGLPTQISAAGYGAPGAVQRYTQNLFQYNDTLSYFRGAHSLKFGVDAERIQLNTFSGDTHGNMQFGGLLPLLAGTPSRFTALLLGSPERGWRRSLFAWFVQDDWRINSRLTLTLGLRQEFMTSPNEVNGLNANLINLTDTKETVGPPFISSKKNFAPRVGMAWDPTGSGKTSIRFGAGLYYNLWDGRNWYMGANAMGLLSGTVTVLNPPFPNPLSAIVPGGAYSTYSIGVNGHLKEPTVAHYNVDIQRQLTNAVSLRVAYVGSDGYNMGRLSALNTRIPTTLADGTQFIAANAPYPNTNFVVGGVSALTADAHYNYNALQTTLEKRLSSGLQLSFSYTFSKTMSDADEVGNGQTTRTAPDTLVPNDLGRDYSLSAYDQRHTLTVNALYKMPWDRSLSSPLMKAVLSGWALSGIYSYGSGLPFDITTGFGRSQNGDNTTTDRPNLTPGFSNNPTHGVTAGCAGIPAGQALRTATRWYDPCAFTLQPAGTYGNLGRNTVTGPGLSVLDTSLVKSARIKERIAIDFRAEFFNLLNHANFGLPSGSQFASNGTRIGSAGVIGSTAVDNRELQLGLKLVF